MNSAEQGKNSLLKRMQDILDQKITSNDKSYERKCRLRDNLISFGEEFLTPDTYDRLIWILKDGGVDLLPMPQIKKPCRKRNRNSDDDYEPPSGEADKCSIRQNWTRRKLESIAKQFSETFLAFDSRIKNLEMSTAIKDIPLELLNRDPSDFVERTKITYDEKLPNPRDDKMNWDSYRKIDLPFRDDTQFEEINKMAEEDPNFYRLVVTQFRQIYDDYFRKGGWRLVYGEIFDKNFVNYYHIMRYRSDEDFVSKEGHVKKPLLKKILIRKGLKDAFPEHDSAELLEELKRWHYRKIDLLQKQKRKQVGSSATKFFTFIDEYDPVEIPEEMLTQINFPIETDVHFEHVNRDAQRNSQLYDQFVHECRKIYKQKIQNGGWREIFDHIFGRGLAILYHFKINMTKAIKTEKGLIRRPIRGKFLTQRLLPGAFSHVDPDEINKNLQDWFRARRDTYQKRLNAAELRGLNDESRDSSIKSSAKSVVAEKSTSKPTAKKKGRSRKRPETEEETTSDEDEDEPLASFSSTKKLRNSTEGDRISHEDILKFVAAVEVEDNKDFVLS